MDTDIPENEMDPKRSYAPIYGHEIYAFMQDGKYYDAAFQLVPTAPPGPPTKRAIDHLNPEDLIETDDVASAKAFLGNILKEGPVAKSIVYNEADKNNYKWESVQKAAALMNIQSRRIGSGAKKTEGWSLARE